MKIVTKNYFPALKLLLVAMLISTFGFIASAQAQTDQLSGFSLDEQNQAFTDSAGLDREVDLSETVSEIIRVLLGFLGIIFLALIVYAGFMWMTSAGNEERVAKSKRIMSAAVIGLAIVLSAYAITFFVIDQILEATRQDNGLDV